MNALMVVVIKQRLPMVMISPDRCGRGVTVLRCDAHGSSEVWGSDRALFLGLKFAGKLFYGRRSGILVSTVVRRARNAGGEIHQQILRQACLARSIPEVREPHFVF